MAKALTRTDLDAMGCAGNHEHTDACSILYFHSRCHPDDPTWTMYDKITGRAVIVCAVCEAEVYRLVVAEVV